MPEPAFLYVLVVLLICAPFAKALSLISGHFLAISQLWQDRHPLVRVVLYYSLDLACSAASLSVLMPFWIGWLFTDAGFAIVMTLFPYALTNGILLAWIVPRTARKRVAGKSTPASAATKASTPYSEDLEAMALHLPVAVFLAAAMSGAIAVISATDSNVEALPVNPQTLQVDNNSIILTPEHIHFALRALAGIPTSLDSQFGIQVPLLNLFG
jgi:hypothetical protein